MNDSPVRNSDQAEDFEPVSPDSQKFLEQVKKGTPRNFAYVTKGVCLLWRGDALRAGQFARMAIEQNEGSANAYALRAKVLLMGGQGAEAAAFAPSALAVAVRLPIPGPRPGARGLRACGASGEGCSTIRAVIANLEWLER